MPRQSPQPNGHADLALVEPATLERLRHESQGDPHRDGVHPEQVAEVVGEDERFGVGDAEHRAEREDRLVLRHLRLRARELAVARSRTACRRRPGTSGRWCRGRGSAASSPRRATAARLRECLLAKVVGAETAEGVDGADEERRAEGRERLGPGLERLPRLSMSALSAAASAISVLRAPFTTTALRFFEPSTAPIPPRPRHASRFFQ